MSKDYYINVFQKGNYMLVSEYKNNVRHFNKYPFKPSLYFLCKEKTPYTNIEGSYLRKNTYENIYECGKYLNEMRDVSNFTPYGTSSYKMQWISENYKDDIDYDFSNFRIGFIDIETCCELGFPEPKIAPEPINALTYYDSLDKKYYVFTLNTLGEVIIKDEDCVHFPCVDEKELLLKFLTLWSSQYPDIYTSWNGTRFDIPYIVNRIKKVLGEKYIEKLSPFGIVNKKEVWDESNFHKKKDENEIPEYKYEFVGLNDLDYLTMYENYSFGEKPSYSLKYITTLELGETKLEHEEFANMHLFYKENYQKFIEYNIQDVKLLVKLDEKLHYLKLNTQIAYLAKVNFRECLSSVIIWESLIYNHEMKKNVFFPIKNVGKVEGGYPGAFVKQPVPSKYKWVVSFDLNSLYPSLIRQFNISPEKILSDDERNRFLYKIKDSNPHLYQRLIESVRIERNDEGNIVKEDDLVNDIVDQTLDTKELKEQNIVLSASGYLFKHDQKGFIPEIMEYIYNQRRSVKKQMLKDENEVERLKAEIHRRGLTI